MKNKLFLVSPLIALMAISCSNSNSIPKEVKFKVPSLGEEAEFHTELQLKYINSTDYLTTSGIASGSSEKSAPQGVYVSWDIEKKGKDPDSYVLSVFDEEMEGDVTIIIREMGIKEKEFYIQNLKLNHRYSFKVGAAYTCGNMKCMEVKESEKYYFTTTSKGPRNLSVENINNFRDLGGHGIKQGLIYRSARFSESDGTSLVSENTRQTIFSLGINTEIDLRRRDENGEITQSPLGEEVHYYHLPMIYGGENILTYVGEHSSGHYDNPVEIKNFFEILADENNYPINFHCSIGKDRTGCMAYLIEALCGMSEEDIYRDYLFSNFSKISGICEPKDIDDRYGKTIADYEGDNLQQKTYNYLNNVIGLDKTTLDSVISILKA